MMPTGQQHYFTAIKRDALLALTIGACLTATASKVCSAEATSSRLAIGGFDATAYFLDGSPKKGRSDFAVELDGATYHFQDELRKERFVNNPRRYLPQYDGLDAYGIFLGLVRPANPTLWNIDRGRLYLFSTRDRLKAWLRSPKGHTQKADRNWPRIKIGLARAEAGRHEDALLADRAANQDCRTVFREHFAAPTRHHLIIDSCTRSAQANNAMGMEFLARVLAERYSPSYDPEKAFELFENAVLLGNESARWRLGDMLARGSGVTQDLQLAFQMYEASADAGVRQGMLRLARSYRFGFGTQANNVLSWAWYNMAATELDVAAAERASLETDMSAVELSFAQLESLRILQRVKAD